MTTAAPKMSSSRWLAIRDSSRAVRSRYPRQIGPGLFQFTDGSVYSRRLWPATLSKPARYDGMVRVRRGL